jgi:nucleotide-binding universal stress UspA family protein
LKRFLVSVIVLLLGCAPRELQGPIPCVRDRCRETLTVAVAAFQDERPDEEFGSPPPRFTPVSEDPAADMSRELAQHLVDRFNSVGFFRSASVVEVSGSPPSTDLLKRLAAQGYDAVITGNVPRCLGSTCVMGGDWTGYFMIRLMGLVTKVLLPLPLGPYHNEGVVSVSDIRLTDTRTGEVVWKGDVSREVVHYTSQPSPGPAIHEAMLEVTKAILEGLQAHLRSGLQAAPVPERP